MSFPFEVLLALVTLFDVKRSRVNISSSLKRSNRKITHVWCLSIFIQFLHTVCDDIYSLNTVYLIKSNGIKVVL